MSKVSSALEFIGLKSKEEMVFKNLNLAAYLQGKITNKELRRRVHLAHIKAANTVVKTDINLYRQEVQLEADTDCDPKGYRTNLLQLSSILVSSNEGIKNDQKETLKKVLKHFDFNATCYEDNSYNQDFLEYKTYSGMASAPRKGFLFSFKDVYSSVYGKTGATVTLRPFENGEVKNIVSFTTNQDDLNMLKQMLEPKKGILGKEYKTLTNENYLTLMTIAKKYKCTSVFPVEASANEVFLASSCKTYLSRKKQLDQENFSIVDTDTHIGSLIDDVQRYISIELGKKRSKKGGEALRAIQTYINEVGKLVSKGNTSSFASELSTLDINLTSALNGIVQNRTWGSYFWSFYSPVPKIASLVAEYKKDIQQKIKETATAAAAAAALKVQIEQEKAELKKDYVDDTLDSLHRLVKTEQLQELQEIVTRKWNGQDISKEDFETTLEFIKGLICTNQETLSSLDITDFQLPGEGKACEPNKDLFSKVKEEDAAGNQILKLLTEMVENASAVSKTNSLNNFSGLLTRLQIDINYLFLHRHKRSGEIVRISDKETYLFSFLRDAFNQAICDTPSATQADPIMIDVGEIKKEIERLSKYYESLNQDLNSFETAIESTARQGDAANKVREFKDDITKRLSTILELKQSLNNFEDGAYNANEEQGTLRHSAVVAVLENLDSNQTSITDAIKSKIDELQAGTIDHHETYQKNSESIFLREKKSLLSKIDSYLNSDSTNMGEKSTISSDYLKKLEKKEEEKKQKEEEKKQKEEEKKQNAKLRNPSFFSPAPKTLGGGVGGGSLIQKA